MILSQIVVAGMPDLTVCEGKIHSPNLVATGIDHFSLLPTVPSLSIGQGPL